MWISLFLLLGSAWAAPPPVCANDGHCPTEMQKIYQAFIQAENLSPKAEPWVGSGACYHNSSHYNPEHKHYGVMLLDVLPNGATHMGGSFGFFFKENPYQTWDFQKVRAEDPRLEQDNHRVLFQNSYGFVDMSATEIIDHRVQYWIREQENRRYLIGLWGRSHMILCEYFSHTP